MRLPGNSQHPQKAKLEEKAVFHLISSMDDFNLNSAHNSNIRRSPSCDHLTEVSLSHTHTHTHTKINKFA